MAEPEITPSVLNFRFQLNKQLPTTITIHNPSSGRLGFKVKTTTPKKYVVRPSSGVVEAKSTGTVQIIMQAQKELPADFSNCKDKFLVQTIALGPSEEVTSDTFKGSGHKDTKVRVQLDGPPAPPSPVPEVNETDEESARSDNKQDAPSTAPGASATSRATPAAPLDQPATLSRDNEVLRAQVQKLQAERDELQRRLTASQAGVRAGSSKAVAAPPIKAPTPPASLLPVLLVGLAAFLVGHYLRSPLALELSWPSPSFGGSST